MSTRGYLFFLRYILPNLKFLHAPGPSYFVKESIRKQMRPGDIMISKSSYALTNWIIGGKFSHGAVVIRRDKIAEMTANDFDVVSVDHFCDGCTRIALLRFKDDPHGEYGREVAKRAMTFTDRRYDARFTLGIEALYCSELCYQSDIEGRMQADLSDLAGMGRKYLSPDGVFVAQGLGVVFDWTDKGWFTLPPNDNSSVTVSHPM